MMVASEPICDNVSMKEEFGNKLKFEYMEYRMSLYTKPIAYPIIMPITNLKALLLSLLFIKNKPIESYVKRF